jgi:hypothetical protein
MFFLRRLTIRWSQQHLSTPISSLLRKSGIFDKIARLQTSLSSPYDICRQDSQLRPLSLYSPSKHGAHCGRTANISLSSNRVYKFCTVAVNFYSQILSISRQAGQQQREPFVYSTANMWRRNDRIREWPSHVYEFLETKFRSLTYMSLI